MLHRLRIQVVESNWGKGRCSHEDHLHINQTNGLKMKHLLSIWKLVEPNEGKPENNIVSWRWSPTSRESFWVGADDDENKRRRGCQGRPSLKKRLSRQSENSSFAFVRPQGHKQVRQRGGGIIMHGLFALRARLSFDFRVGARHFFSSRQWDVCN